MGSAEYLDRATVPGNGAAVRSVGDEGRCRRARAGHTVRKRVPLPTFAAAAFAACIATTAVGDTFDPDGKRITFLAVTQDESTGGLDRAILTIYDQSGADAGWAGVSCADQWPTLAFNVLVLDSRSADRQDQSETEIVRTRVDRHPVRQFESVGVSDIPDSMRGSTSARHLSPERGFVEELAAGQGLIVQIGGLRILSLDLATAKPDIVEFKNACDQMYDNMMRSPRRWAQGMELQLNPFTDRGWDALWLFHETSHDGGYQPRFFVHCQNDERRHGVNFGVYLPRPLQGSVLSDGATSTLLVRVDAGADQEIAVAKDADERWTTFHLSAERRPAEEFLDRLGRGSAMTVRWSDLPEFRFDLAGGRPAITDFGAKCEAMLRLPSIEKVRERAGQN